MKYLKKIQKAFVILFLTSSLIFSASYINNFFEISKSLDIFATLFKQLHVYYVEDINSGELIKTAIDKMLESLDPYTNYISEDEIEDFRFMTTGQYGGIGALIQNREEYIVISEPYFGYPAQKAGLLAGDKIIEVNGVNIRGMSSSDVRNMLRGQPQTAIKIKVERLNIENMLEFEVIREDVKIENIPYTGVVGDDIGYIKLSGFTENAGRETKDAFMKLKDEKGIKKIILDLRGNGGGLLNEAVNIVNIFFERGNLIVSTKGKIVERNTRHLSLNPAVDTLIPLVVLIDRGSASASEIVAGAIQDYDRGVIIGQRSFGKGLVQNVVPLSYNSKLKVTVAKYYIPSGRCIQAINYAVRDEDGSVIKIPDSLKVAFKTRAGRTVYDGGGIEPDVFVEPYRYSNIGTSLITKHLIFDYATKFFFEHPTISEARNFEITDGMYNDFVAFINGKDYDYKTDTEQMLELLKETAIEEKYFEQITSEYEQLNRSLAHNKEEDLITFKDEIKYFLKSEIVSRYYYQTGRIEVALLFDSEITKAIEILNNQEAYSEILKGTYTAH
ncbi:MAG: S41 family peptidase [Bacteroidales bacterium]|nr:S41 family peptidase [Bacteroidales bacterium]